MENFERDKQLSQEDARMEIMAIRQEVAQMGANDSEFDNIEQILKELDSDDITPEEAVGRTQEIIGSKQDYH